MRYQLSFSHAGDEAPFSRTGSVSLVQLILISSTVISEEFEIKKDQYCEFRISKCIAVALVARRNENGT